MLNSDDLISGFVHGLRAPLANLYLALRMMKLAPSQEEEEQYYNLAIRECERELELINSLLNLKQIIAGCYRPSYRSINLNSLVPDLFKVFEVRAKAQGQIISLDIDPELPTVVSDFTLINKILQELLHNACKYTERHGEICLEVDLASPGVEIVISNSAQIPESSLPHLFDRFYRVPASDSFNQGGSGLGLAVVKDMVELLQGKIQVTSQSGWTTFRIWLPRTPNLSSVVVS